MNTIKKETANSKTANPFQPTSTGGGVNDNLRITLGADASSDYSKCPKQVQLVCNYLHELGGTATMQQLNDFATRYEGSLEEQGTLQSEEFMVQLGGLLANKNITFDPTFLEQLKAYIGNILRKITGGNINFGDLTTLSKNKTTIYLWSRWRVSRPG